MLLFMNCSVIFMGYVVLAICDDHHAVVRHFCHKLMINMCCGNLLWIMIILHCFFIIIIIIFDQQEFIAGSLTLNKL